ncbi:hypothetical protein [Halopseudomonas sabulinigri]|uniref:MFS transporter, DHA2 family, multidrug resistance protein n=1 Tax=Halopseudomonas sabulinigri TaxID=472181 RepID=A0ABP9ZL07_9GAMM
MLGHDGRILALRQATELGAYSINSTAGLAGLNQELNRQAATLGYLQDFRFMMWIALSAFPLLLLLQRSPQRRQGDAVVME